MVALGLVAAACAVGQAAVLVRRPLIFELPDSASYIAVASRLVRQPDLVNLFDAYRTPGYPAFLALVAALQGSVAGSWVVYTQAALVVVAAFEVFALTAGLTGSRAAAAVAAVLFGSNVRLLDWERLIMTESLSIFLVVTVALAFWLWLSRRSARWAVAFAAASALAVLVRPSLVYLPAGLLAVLLASDRRRWLPVVLVAAAVYLPALGYGAVNDRLHPGAGLSAVGSVNLLGKILEYRMEGEGDEGRFAALWKGIGELPPGDRDPYDILKADPGAFGPNYADASAFSVDIIARHPFEYLAKSAVDFTGQWWIAPFAFIPPGRYSWVAQGLAGFALLTYVAYIALPAAVAVLIVLWRRLERQAAVGIAALFVAVIGGLVSNSLFGYVDFARLRTPVDALALVAVVALAVAARRPQPGSGQNV
jgi:4-amino-4-deoxy-L-arabinose transferase-like glycosyltransferase